MRVDIVSNPGAQQAAGAPLLAAGPQSASFSDVLARSSQAQGQELSAGNAQSLPVKNAQAKDTQTIGTQAKSAPAQDPAAKSMPAQTQPGQPPLGRSQSGRTQPPVLSGIVAQLPKASPDLKGQAKAKISAAFGLSAASLSAAFFDAAVKVNEKTATPLAALLMGPLAQTKAETVSPNAVPVETVSQDEPKAASLAVAGASAIALPVAAAPISGELSSSSKGPSTAVGSPTPITAASSAYDPSRPGTPATASPATPGLLSDLPSSAMLEQAHATPLDLQEPLFRSQEPPRSQSVISTVSPLNGSAPQDESGLPNALIVPSAPLAALQEQAASAFSAPDVVPDAPDSGGHSTRQPAPIGSEGATPTKIVSPNENALAPANSVRAAEIPLPLGNAPQSTQSAQPVRHSTQPVGPSAQQAVQTVAGNVPQVHFESPSPMIALTEAGDVTAFTAAAAVPSAPPKAVASMTTKDSLSVAQSLLPQVDSLLASATSADTAFSSARNSQPPASAAADGRHPAVSQSATASEDFSIRDTALAASGRETIGSAYSPQTHDVGASAQNDKPYAIPTTPGKSSGGSIIDSVANPIPGGDAAAAQGSNPAAELVRPDAGHLLSADDPANEVQAASSGAVPAPSSAGQKLPAAARAAASAPSSLSSAGPSPSSSITVPPASQGNSSDVASPVLVAPAAGNASVASATPDKAVSAPELPPAHQMLDSAPAASDSMPAASGAHLVPEGAAVQLQVGVHTSAFGNVEVHTVIEQSQVGIAIHGDRDLARWFNSEIGGIETGLKAQHLNLTGVDFSSTRSEVQTTTSFQQGQPRQHSPQTPGSYAALPPNAVAAEASAESDPDTAYLAPMPETRVSILV